MGITIDEIRQYILDSEQESSRLEFKRGAALGRDPAQRVELIKDVTGFANGDGGRIIYGIDEQEQGGVKVATQFSPVVDRRITRESIGQMLRANTGPSLSKFEIAELQVPIENGDGRVIVVDIDAAFTAHQNSLDKRYYLRAGATTEAMLDFQIRDVMNRHIRPILEITLRKRVEGRDPFVLAISPSIRNSGQITMERWIFEIDIPASAVNHPVVQADFAHSGIPRHRLLGGHGVDVWKFIIAPPIEQRAGQLPLYLHPGQSLLIGPEMGVPQLRATVNDAAFRELERTRPPIAWRVFMWNSAPLTGEISFEDWCEH